jgi:cyclohexadieny/prephenate dehydrogenase
MGARWGPWLMAELAPTFARPLFDKIALIGIGLIGSSLARAIKAHGLAHEVVCAARQCETRQKALSLGLVDAAYEDPAQAVCEADLVMLATPLSSYDAIGRAIAPLLSAGTIVSDVGSVKLPVVRDLAPLLPAGVHLVPGHPIAGTEQSGPEAGFAELFHGRWVILTPSAETDGGAVQKVSQLWQACGSQVEIMQAAHHDRVLAITSHLPHLIAYTIVGTAADLEEDTKSEVIKFSASGFRDFTRIAASDPTMWRDIFLTNREAVLEILQRFSEDLTALQRAIRWGEGEMLFDAFTRTRAIRRAIISAKQDR